MPDRLGSAVLEPASVAIGSASASTAAIAVPTSVIGALDVGRLVGVLAGLEVGDDGAEIGHHGLAGAQDRRRALGQGRGRRAETFGDGQARMRQRGERGEGLDVHGVCLLPS